MIGRFFSFSLLLLISHCSCNKEERFLGKMPAPVTKTVYFKVYQSNNFDSFTSLSSEIVNQNDSVIVSRHFLAGTDLFEYNTDNFRVGEFDSIIYITYFDPNEIIGIYDLRNNIGYPFYLKDYQQAQLHGDSLLKRLHYYNNKLFGYWNR